MVNTHICVASLIVYRSFLPSPRGLEEKNRRPNHSKTKSSRLHATWAKTSRVTTDLSSTPTSKIIFRQTHRRYGGFRNKIPAPAHLFVPIIAPFGIFDFDRRPENTPQRHQPNQTPRCQRKARNKRTICITRYVSRTREEQTKENSFSAIHWLVLRIRGASCLILYMNTKKTNRRSLRVTYF